MEFSSFSNINKRKAADLLVIPFWKAQKGVACAGEAGNLLTPQLTQLLKLGDFKAKEGEIFYFFDENSLEKRLILLGLGVKDKLTAESLRCTYASLTKFCMQKKFTAINLILPQIEQLKLKREDIVSGIAEGLLLANYFYDKPKKAVDENEKNTHLQSVGWIGANKSDLELINKAHSICEGVCLARDLINGNADDITPQFLEKCALNIAKESSHIKATVFNKARIQKERLDLLLAVNRGSALDPAFIILEYKGNPKSKEHVVLVGKGVTYDTGGLNLKPTGSMETMKCDMSGAAACLGAMLAVVNLQLKVNFTIVIPSTENGIDAKSFKPGDVYRSYSGKTVEMMNSDAEGRLILADALAYASKNLKPTYLIDIATLTGAIEIALGSEASGLMSTDDHLAQSLIAAGEKTFERLWRMPLYEEYKDRLKSDFADLKSWNGRGAGANVAATFLSQFVDEKIAWAHLDIAATAYSSEAKKYLPKYGTGVGVRLILQFLEDLK